MMAVPLLLLVSLALLVYLTRAPRPSPVVLPILATVNLIATYEAALAVEHWQATAHLVIGVSLLCATGYLLARQPR